MDDVKIIMYWSHGGDAQSTTPDGSTYVSKEGVLDSGVDRDGNEHPVKEEHVEFLLQQGYTFSGDGKNQPPPAETTSPAVAGTDYTGLPAPVATGTPTPAPDSGTTVTVNDQTAAPEPAAPVAPSPDQVTPPPANDVPAPSTDTSAAEPATPVPAGPPPEPVYPVDPAASAPDGVAGPTPAPDVTATPAVAAQPAVAPVPGPTDAPPSVQDTPAPSEPVGTTAPSAPVETTAPLGDATNAGSVAPDAPTDAGQHTIGGLSSTDAAQPGPATANPADMSTEAGNVPASETPASSAQQTPNA